jgi:hypothetical protein
MTNLKGMRIVVRMGGRRRLLHRDDKAEDASPT